jgi:protein farnesyltransferase/geranylgeranyltransferase type-1 subunit alpha
MLTDFFARLCLFALGSDLKSELHRMIEVALDNSKNYQVWYHRRLLLEKLKADPDAAVLANKELELTAMALKDDNKNYHAWSHRYDRYCALVLRRANTIG